MSLSPLSFVVVAGIETNKGKLLSLPCLDCNLYQFIMYFSDHFESKSSSVLSFQIVIYIYILDRNHHQGCSLLYFKGCLYHGVIDLYHRYEYVDLSGTTDFVVSFSIEETRCWLVVYIDWYKYVNVYEYVIFYIICHGVNRIHCFSESFTGRAFHIREQVILPQYMFTRSCNPFFLLIFGDHSKSNVLFTL